MGSHTALVGRASGLPLPRDHFARLAVPVLFSLCSTALVGHGALEIETLPLSNIKRDKHTPYTQRMYTCTVSTKQRMHLRVLRYSKFIPSEHTMTR